MRLNPLVFTGVKVEEDPQAFVDDIEKILCVMQATNVKGVEFAAYQLKDVAYQWREEYEWTKGDYAESALWDNFSSVFLDRFFSQELSKTKAEEFYGQLYRGYCDEGKDKCFNCGQVGHILRKYLVGKLSSGANKVPIVSSSTLALKGELSSFDTSCNYLYAFTTHHESEVFPDVVTSMLNFFSCEEVAQLSLGDEVKEKQVLDPILMRIKKDIDG
ncbi:uncharacterized protein LOC107868964 [Capsicum annuum]|uniref:uncharacterized protein LOC107868964 n=1 Tax=Capsicum annuum TaxID=4072 RepID=UPI001FB1501F|nr:uncharacterized protein LOC107868964 [Capsicum annuum]